MSLVLALSKDSVFCSPPSSVHHQVLQLLLPSEYFLSKPSNMLWSPSSWESSEPSYSIVAYKALPTPVYFLKLYPLLRYSWDVLRCCLWAPGLVLCLMTLGSQGPCAKSSPVGIQGPTLPAHYYLLPPCLLEITAPQKHSPFISPLIN